LKKNNVKGRLNNEGDYISISAAEANLLPLINTLSKMYVLEQFMLSLFYKYEHLYIGSIMATFF